MFMIDNQGMPAEQENHNILEKVKFVQLDLMSPYHTLHDLSALVRTIIGQMTPLPRIFWEDWTFTSLRIKTHFIRLEWLQDLTRAMLKAAETELHEKLMLNMTGWSQSDNLAASMMEDPHNSDIGYSFLSFDGKCVEEMKRWQDLLFEHIIKTPELCGHWIEFYDEAHVAGTRWNKLTLNQFLIHAEQFQEILCSLLHLTGGQPARGTELETALLTNTQSAMRSLYVLHDLLCLILSYNKTMNLTLKENVIYRYFPREVSNLVIKYLVYVKPLEMFCASQLYGPDGLAAHSKYLFVNHGEKMTSRDITRSFERMCQRFGGIPLSFADYRHVCIGFAKKHIVNKETDFSHWVHAQAGHSSKVADEHYAVSLETIANISEDSILMFYRSSQCWHRLLGFHNNLESQQQSSSSLGIVISNNNIPIIVQEQHLPLAAPIQSENRSLNSNSFT